MQDCLNCGVFVRIRVWYIVKVHRTVTVIVLLKVTLKVSVKVLKVTLKVLPYYFLFFLSESGLDADVDYRLNQGFTGFLGFSGLYANVD